MTTSMDTTSTNTTSTDTTSPTATFSPANSALNVEVSSNLVLSFSEAVQKGKGNIVIGAGENNAPVTIPVSSSRITLSNNGTIVTIDPEKDLLPDKTYDIRIEEGAFQDIAGNPYAGTSPQDPHGMMTLWKFTTKPDAAMPPNTTGTPPDTIAPTATFSPTDESKDVEVSTNLVLTFDEVVQKGTTGTIALIKDGKTDSNNLKLINLSSPEVVIGADGKTVTINPNDDLAPGINYTIGISEGAFTDAAGNKFAGIKNPAVWNFTTKAKALENPSPLGGDNPVADKPKDGKLGDGKLGDGKPGDSKPSSTDKAFGEKFVELPDLKSITVKEAKSAVTDFFKQDNGAFASKKYAKLYGKIIQQNGDLIDYLKPIVQGGIKNYGSYVSDFLTDKPSAKSEPGLVIQGKNEGIAKGSSANDLIIGNQSDQTFEGGKGNDRLFGGGGSDFLSGGEGDDILHGGAGSDKITTGKGKDLVVCSKIKPKENPDVVTDFDVALDVIDLRSVLKGLGGSKLEKFNQFVKLEEIKGGTAVKIDLDGNGSKTIFGTNVVLQGAKPETLTAHNFSL